MRVAQVVVDKQERARKANELIEIIAFRGRRFFNHRYGISCFRVDRRGRVWFWDGHTAVCIYVAYKHWSKGFAQGGTLRAFVNALRDYIRTGESIFTEHLGPWGHNGDNYLGYGEDMYAVRAKAIELGIVKSGGGTAQ